MRASNSPPYGMFRRRCNERVHHESRARSVVSHAARLTDDYGTSRSNSSISPQKFEIKIDIEPAVPT